MALQLHLGCGKRYIPGFVHIDIADFPHIDHLAGIDKLPMFGDDTVDLIYCCHAFQYFDRHQAALVLEEWRRVLRPGGVLRLSVPSLEALVRIYETSHDINHVLGPLFGRMTVNTPTGDTLLYHKTVYDYDSLKTICFQAGFRSFCQYDWRKTSHSEYDDYSQAYRPHMDKEKGILISLNVEALK